MLLRLALVTGALLLTSSAMAADTVFGITLGENFSVSECKKTKIGYEYSTKTICFKRGLLNEKATSPVTDETVTIEFPIFESPPLMASNRMTGLIIEGRLEGVGFNTRGIRTQDEVLSSLKTKYGEPRHVEHRTVQNRMGASFNVFDAVWTSEALEVTYQSVTTTVDSGLVIVDTKKGAAWRQQKLQEIRQRGPAL